MQHVTAVVVTYNRIDLLKECLQALREQKVDRDTQLDIFLVDNASTDGTKEWIDGMVRQAYLCDPSGREYGWSRWILYRYEMGV